MPFNYTRIDAQAAAAAALGRNRQPDVVGSELIDTPRDGK